MTKIIAVSNHKGGVGKTTSTVNLGAALASKGYKVCLVDLDPQANLTQTFLKESNPDHSIYHLLKKKEWCDYLPTKINENLCIIPSCLYLSAAESELISELGRESILKNLFTSFKIDSGYTNDYKNLDYILIDCPPSLGLLTINAFAAANDVWIPLQAEYLPLHGLVRIQNVIQNIKKSLNHHTLKISGVFFTKYDHRKILNKDVAEKVRDMFGDTLLNTTISNNIALAEGPSCQQDIFSYDNKCKGAMEYMALCEEILEREALDEKEKL